MQLRKLRTLTLMASTGAFAIILAACGGSSTAGTSASATVPAGLGVKTFDASYSAVAQLKSLVTAGGRKGGGGFSPPPPPPPPGSPLPPRPHPGPPPPAGAPAAAQETKHPRPPPPPP